jgi:uncharacterized protein (UPF0261 family)
MVAVAREVGRRLQHTQEPAIVLIPSRGFDSYNTAGQPFFDPQADGAFVAELKTCLPSKIKVIERPTHINDPDFATEAAQLLIGLVEGQRSA